MMMPQDVIEKRYNVTDGRGGIVVIRNRDERQ